MFPRPLIHGPEKPSGTCDTLPRVLSHYATLSRYAAAKESEGFFPLALYQEFCATEGSPKGLEQCHRLLGLEPFQMSKLNGRFPLHWLFHLYCELLHYKK